MKPRKKQADRPPRKLAADVVQARALVLVDEQGKHRASLSCSSDGDQGFTVFHLNDGEGRPRITLQIDSAGNPSVVLFTSDNGCGVSLAVNENGSGVSITAERSGISFGVPGPKNDDPRGCHPSIDVVDSKGKRTWSVFEGIKHHPDSGDVAATRSAGA